MLRRLLLVLLTSVGTFTYAQTTTAGTPVESESRPTFYSRIQGLFDFELPDIDPPGTVKLIVHPHFGDLIRRDYMRVDTGFRWAINERFEISPEGAVYFNHGMGDSNDSGYGVGELRLGSKYVIPQWPCPHMETSVTLAVEMPINDAPIDMTDGLNHITPAFLMQHRMQRWEKWTTFGGAGLDLVSISDVAGTPIRNQPREDSMNFTVGAIYDLGQVKWTLSTTYATTNFIGDESEDFFYVRPNVLWYVPKKYTFNSKTQWILGLGARLSWGPDGTEVSTSTRVRAEITFRQVMQKIRTLKPSEKNRP